MRLLVACIFLGFISAQKDNVKLFKSEKINYIYDKALNHVGDQGKLDRLKDELQSYDTLYMDTKHEYAHSERSVLKKELGKIDKKLMKLLETHGLQNTVQAFREKVKFDEYRGSDDFDAATVHFADERLDKLWKSAADNSFSQTEMKELYNELKDAERLMDEHEEAVNAMNKVPGENDLHFDMDDDVKHITEKEKRIKDTHKKLDSHLDNLHKKVQGGEESTPFKTEKVKKMWKLAQANTKFSAHDLKILEDELVHFDKQIRKFDNHVTLRENRGDKSQLEHLEDVEMDAKHERISRKMRKLEKYLQSKVQHSEL